MDDLNRLMTEQPFVFFVISLVLSALVGAYIRDVINWFRQIRAMQSKTKAISRINEIVKETSIVQRIVDDPQFGIMHFVVGQIKALWIMSGAVFFMYFILMGVIFDALKDRPGISFFFGSCWIMFSVGSIRLARLSERYDRVIRSDQYKVSVSREAKRLIEKHQIEVEIPELEITKKDNIV